MDAQQAVAKALAEQLEQFARHAPIRPGDYDDTLVARLAFFDEQGEIHIAHYGKATPLGPIDGVPCSEILDALAQGRLPCLVSHCKRTLCLSDFEAWKGCCYRHFYEHHCGVNIYEERERYE